MGDPKRNRAKFSTPKKAWEKERIEEEKELIKEYHFKNKQEIWKLTSKLRNFSRQAKRLIVLKTEQAEKEKIQLLNKLKSLGLLSEQGDLDDVLGITTKDLLDRRLQTVVFKKGFAKSMKQARQFIVHGHIVIENKKITSPNFLVSVENEGKVGFSQSSELSDEMHPERKKEEKLPKKPKAKGEKGKSKENKKDSKEESKPKKEKKESKENKKESKEKSKPKKKEKSTEKKKKAE
ncbi:30S ribosomal protein S4 [Candidatus Woesearchaeota archaeon]|nr:30S ribosomal protein S4 [Candidatus Woesearchaeota archaeon]